MVIKLRTLLGTCRRQTDEKTSTTMQPMFCVSFLLIILLRRDQSNLSSESGSEEGEELCIPQNASVCFNIMKGEPGLQIRTRNTYSAWSRCH